jgi:predicted DNA-binding transcriptional regulator AlpA
VDAPGHSGLRYISGQAMKARSRKAARASGMQSAVTEPVAVEPHRVISLIEAAIMTGLEPADIKWLERQGRFPRALRLPGRQNRVVLTFLRDEVVAWLEQKITEHRNILAGIAGSATGPSGPAPE